MVFFFFLPLWTWKKWKQISWTLSQSHALIVNLLLTISIHLKMAPKSMKLHNKFPSYVEDGISIAKPSKGTQGGPT
jgi:hypothetical protein